MGSCPKLSWMTPNRQLAALTSWSQIYPRRSPCPGCPPSQVPSPRVSSVPGPPSHSQDISVHRYCCHPDRSDLRPQLPLWDCMVTICDSLQRLFRLGTSGTWNSPQESHAGCKEKAKILAPATETACLPEILCCFDLLSNHLAGQTGAETRWWAGPLRPQLLSYAYPKDGLGSDWTSLVPFPCGHSE